MSIDIPHFEEPYARIYIILELFDIFAYCYLCTLLYTLYLCLGYIKRLHDNLCVGAVGTSRRATSCGVLSLMAWKPECKFQNPTLQLLVGLLATMK